MSKERLEEMNKKVVGLTDGEDFSDLVQMDVDTYAWFYKQAELNIKNRKQMSDMRNKISNQRKEIHDLRDKQHRTQTYIRHLKRGTNLS